ncbi:head maturation protease, ClpP-related (plasmid) [Microbulbifer sp. ANSA001]|uniref:head maturation protease, ClpP-related n=1 Tax=Microbulbifer sp. ANSA001 TaxID=3243358 RepID=UPI00404273FE
MFPFFVRGAEGQPHQVLLYDVIGESFWEASITAKQIVTALAAVPDDDVKVRINCEGGDHRDGTAIYNALANHKGNVDILVEGYACSMATGVMCAGNKVEMFETALLMIHRASTSIYGNAKELIRRAEVLEKADQSIAAAYSRKTGKTSEEMLALIDEKGDAWLTPAEAKEIGLIDEIVVPEKFTALLDKTAVTALGKNEGASIVSLSRAPKAMKDALEGVTGAVAVRVTGGKIEPVKAQADTSPADTSPTDTSPADSVTAERERVKAIHAQARACGMSADDDLVVDLIDQGVKEELAGSVFHSMKVQQDKVTAVRGSHQPNHSPGSDQQQVQASWASAFNKTR